jgi:Raf kinase inhibitor-like YbhB/YbcL family protein
MEAEMENPTDKAPDLVPAHVKGACMALIVYLLAALSASFVAAQTSAKSPSGIKVETNAFQPGGAIPSKYTCDGEDVSPSLKWADPPAGTKSFVLIVDDPDAPGGVFTHWIVTGIRSDVRELPEGINKNENLLRASGGKQDRNDFGKTGYNGPCPPPGKPHRYYFQLWALDSPLNFPGIDDAHSKGMLRDAMDGHVLAKGDTMGKYQRK